VTLINPALFIGNALLPPSPEAYSVANDATSFCDPFIWAFNKFMNADDSQAYAVEYGINTNINIGGAFIQNVIESGKAGGSVPWDVMYSQRDNEWCTNVLNWNNTCLGHYHMPFNLGGFRNVSIDHYGDINNLFGSREIEEDVSSQNSSATNRWALLFSVGCFNNASTEIGLPPNAAIGYNPAGTELGFDGVPSYYNILTNSFAIKFVENGSAYGGNGNGLGDYKLQTTSPVINPYLIGPVLLPYDIAGVARGGMDPPGAYSLASAMVVLEVMPAAGGQLTLEWLRGTLERTSNMLSGAWTPVTGATSPYLVSPAGHATFYRVHVQ
jgi:hypothetical protein